MKRVTLDKQDYTKLKALAGKLDLSTIWVLRHAAAEFIARRGNGGEDELALRRAGTKFV